MFEIGSTLRQARDRLHLGLDQAEAETKIRARYLRALEDEDFDVLPGPTYVRGFLRTYAAYLGLDGQLYVDEYNSRFFDPSEEDQYLARRRQLNRDRRGRRQSHAVLVALAAIVAIAVLVIVAATYPRSSPPQAPSTPIRSTGTTTRVGNPAVIATTTAAPGSVSTPAGGKVSLAVVAADKAVYVTIYQGRGRTGRQLFSNTIEGKTSHDSTPMFRNDVGFTVEVGVPGATKLVVNGNSNLIPTGTRFFVRPNGTVEQLR
jgi:cytoskeletal protein RodZ